MKKSPGPKAGANAGPGDHATGFDVALSPAGEVVAVGTFANVMDFGGGEMTSKDLSNDIFVVRYAADGEYLMSQAFAGSDTEFLSSTASGPPPKSTPFPARPAIVSNPAPERTTFATFTSALAGYVRCHR